LEDPRVTISHLHDPAYLLGGKTIVGALIGGLIAVETIKKQIGERRSTGDLFAIPLALGIAIGRVGCFLTGLSDNTYGTVTSLPWGIDFGDGLRRHPTQLYEILFLLALIPLLNKIMHGNIDRHSLPGDSRFQRGDTFRFLMVTYMSFRILCDFIKPYSRVALGLGTIQWAGVLILLYYANDILRWLKWSATTRPGTEAP
jgi:phosphatidylglycerol:prolipoprotein diacylglycerol transferase